MKFRYYLVLLDTGDVCGTNDLEVAKSYAPSEEAWVIDTKENKWMLEDHFVEISEIE